MLGRVGERASDLEKGAASHRVWRSEITGGHSAQAILWCSKCGAYARETVGKPQLLAGLCLEKPPSKAKAQELALLRKGLHPAHCPKNRRREGEGSRLALGPARPVPAEELEEARGTKREGAQTAPGGVRRLRVEQRAPPLTLAQWCAAVGLTRRDFARDDRRQQLCKRRRLRGKFAPGTPPSSEEES